MNRAAVITFVVLFTSIAVAAQTGAPAHQSVDPMAQIAADVSSVSRSVKTLSDRLKEFVDKWEKVGGLTLTEKQQRLVLGMEMLMRAEQRVATLQKFQIDLTDKQNEVRSRLTQIESDLRPRNIDRGLALEGTTETEELRETRRQKLQNERSALNNLLQQVERNLADANDNVREAQSLAFRLRRTFLPQIEREIYDQ